MLAELGRRGRRALGLKPIESGIEGEGGPSDASELMGQSAVRPSVAPYRFREPISPHLAARRAGIPIELERTLRYVQLHESGPAPLDVVLVETAGGLFSPLSDSLTNWDFARALEPARWVLVAPDALGVLHDVRATLEASRARGRVPDELVLSGARPADESTGTNGEELVRLGLTRRVFACDKSDPSGIPALADALLAARDG